MVPYMIKKVRILAPLLVKVGTCSIVRFKNCIR